METAIIVAHDPNGVIGVDGKLPWNIPNDLKRFRRLTYGHALIMGRRTWESLGSKPLIGRHNLVLSRSFKFGIYRAYDGHLESKHMRDALGYFYDIGVEKAFIIGGTEVFTEGMEYVDKVYRTAILDEVTASQELAYFREHLELHTHWWLKSREPAGDCVFEEFTRFTNASIRL